MRPGLGIVNLPLARQLVALLSVLASSLAIALAGDHRAARAFATDVAGGETQIDDGRTVLDAFRLMLDAARVQRDGALGFPEPVCRLFD